MKIKVLFFASAREAVGGLTELLLDLEPMIDDEDDVVPAAVAAAAEPRPDDGAATVAPAGGSSATATGGAGGGNNGINGTTITTKQLRRELAARYPHLAATMQTITLAVNEEYVHDDDDEDPVLLSDGDTVALIPPISGG
jgi:molybdopterin converting factor small subunit